MTEPVGRPPKYKSKNQLETLIEEYFDGDAWIEQGDTKSFCPTVEGLSYALDLTRKSLLDYEEKEEFSYTIKRAKQKIAIALEQKLFGNNVTGTIFNLKNNFGWKDKTETEHSGSIHMTHEQWLDNLEDE